jgi:hypothetical protein
VVGWEVEAKAAVATVAGVGVVQAEVAPVVRVEAVMAAGGCTPVLLAFRTVVKEEKEEAAVEAPEVVAEEAKEEKEEAAVVGSVVGVTGRIRV